MVRLAFSLLMVGLLAACAGNADLNKPPVPLGDFRLGHNIVVANKATRGPLSRKATEEQLSEAVQAAMAERFGRYDGPSLYHFGVSVEGYVLAQPAIPVVLAPKSTLVLNVTVWDDAAGKKLNDKPQQITVIETLGAGSIIGSGYTLGAEEQLIELSQNAAKAVERYLVMRRNEQGWFTATPDLNAQGGAQAAEILETTPPV